MLPGLKFPVRNVFCIGRNYAEHARELKNEIPSQPVVFLKPTGALTVGGEPIRIPSITQNVHHEVEVVVAMGANLSIAGVAIGIDITARDLQDQAKAKGLPWTLAKGLESFAPVSDFLPAAQIGALDQIRLELSVNGERKQQGVTSDMLFAIPKLIDYLAQNFGLAEGDLIFTGTPSGVGPIKPGDEILARLDTSTGHHRTLEISVVDVGV